MYFVFYIGNKKVNLNIRVVEILGKMLYLLWPSERFPRVFHCLTNRISAEDPNSAKSFKTPPNLPFLTTRAASYQLAVVLSPTDCWLTVTTLYADWLLADCLHYQLLGSYAASVAGYWTHCEMDCRLCTQIQFERNYFTRARCGRPRTRVSPGVFHYAVEIIRFSSQNFSRGAWDDWCQCWDYERENKWLVLQMNSFGIPLELY